MGVPWFWSLENRGSHISLSNNRATAVGNHYNWEKVLGNVVWTSGKHRMEFMIDFNMLVSNNMWQIIVGVAHPSTDLVSCLGDGER